MRLCLVLIGGRLGDVLTTAFALQHGYHEYAPVTVLLFASGGWPLVLLTTAALTAAACAIVRALPTAPLPRWLTRGLTVAIVTVWCLPLCLNLLTLAHLIP